MTKKYISASIICSDFTNLKEDVRLIDMGGVDFIHVDVMDGHFVPRLGIFPEIITSIKSLTKTKLDIHLMADRPLDWLSILSKNNPEYICVHAESTDNLHYVIQKIRENGIKAGVVLNPATPLSVLDYLISEIDMVVIMMINPGIVGHKLIPTMMDKIKKLKEYRDINNGNFLIEVDGGVNFETGQKMVELGADVLVCGSSTIFNQEKALDVKIREFANLINIK